MNNAPNKSSQGQVKWFDEKKGYGFITSDAAPTDVFVHYSEIRKNSQYKALEEGELVEFNLVVTEKGYQAHAVGTIHLSAVPTAQAGKSGSEKGGSDNG